MIFLILALVASGAVAHPVSRHAMAGATKGYARGYMKTVRADRTKRKLVRSVARAAQIKHWKSKKSGWSGTAKWRAWQVASWSGSVARSHARATWSGTKEVRSGFKEGAQKGREVRAAKKEARTQKLAAAEAAELNKATTPEPTQAPEPPTQGAPMLQAEFTTAQEIITAVEAASAQVVAQVEELTALLTGISEGSVKSKSILDGVETGFEALSSMEAVCAALTAISEGARRLVSIGESMASEEVEHDVTVGALVA